MTHSARIPTAQDPAVRRLIEAGLLRADGLKISPLSGGVSCDVLLAEDGQNRLVFKRALARLRVADEWKADVGRNATEHRYLSYVAKIVPDAVPRVLLADDALHFFAMDYVGNGFVTWKSELLAGQFDPLVARRVGTILGSIHQQTRDDASAEARFETTRNFHDLRLAPYLLTTGARHPDLTTLFINEAARITGTRECLIHGDYSPKNLLTDGARIVVIDCEVAWYGDPSFDVAFLLNHLFLKSLRRPATGAELLALASAFWKAYAACLETPWARAIERRVLTLLPMLMLARVDGKSPAEYLTHRAQKDFIRAFARRALGKPALHLESFSEHWLQQISAYAATAPS